MKIKIQYSCGHKATLDLFGDEAELGLQKRTLEAESCSQCLLSAESKEISEKSKEASRWAEAEGLPDLEGPEDLVEDGNVIRQKVLTQAAKKLPSPEVLEEPARTVLKHALLKLVEETRAVWWQNQGKWAIDKKIQEIDLKIRSVVVGKLSLELGEKEPAVPKSWEVKSDEGK